MPSEVLLNQNEKATFHALVRYPSFNDREIGEVTGIKTSTVTAIRKRLLRKKMYSTIRVPNFRMLGFELMIVGYGPLPIGEKGAESIRACSEAFLGTKEIFFAAHTGELAFFIAAAKNYTAAKRFIDSLMRSISEYSFVEDWNFIFFPFELTAVLNFFDCSNIMERKLGFDQGSKDSHFFDSSEVVSISNRENLVLKKLVEHPELPDVSIASMSGVSRQSVAGMRKKFERKELIKTLKIPNFSSLNLEIMVLAHTFFNPNTSLSDRKDGVKYMVESVPQFFLASGNYENIMLAISKNYEEFSFFKNQILKLYQRKEFVKKDPRIFLMPINETRIVKNHDYAPLLDKSLKTR